ncbi:MAG: (S)-mandelate dehydrogenase [Gammaproteobacteria bacterium]
MNLDNCINLDDLRRAAKRRVPKVIFDFIEGGIDDEGGLTRNSNAFQNRPLVPRYMTGVDKGEQRASIFGREYSSPFGIAPTGGIGNFRRGGDLMLASAARAANIPFIMSGAATASMEDMVKTAPEHGWYQTYLAKDRSITDDMIRRANALGIPTLVITVDVPGPANRERNRRNGFGRPLRLSLASKLNALKHPAWMGNYLRHGIAMLPNWAPYAGDSPSAVDVANFVAEQIPCPVRWDDILRIRDLWPGNLVVKGIMRVDDALRLADAGVDGLMVSNHGARQLDRAPSPLDVLPGIVDAVGERMTIMLDSGIQRGSDALTALSLGAKFVFLGRGTLYGVVAGGEAGATRAINILSNEINQVMVQIGCPSLDALGPDFVEWDPEIRARNHFR